MPKDLSSLRLASALPVEGSTLKLRFTDGAEYLLDLDPDLRGLSCPLVDSLRKDEIFRQVKVEAGSFVFPTGLDYGGDVLRFVVRSGRCSRRTDDCQVSAAPISSHGVFSHRPKVGCCRGEVGGESL